MNHNRKPLIFTAILHVSVKYIYGAERIKSLTFQRNLWWQSEKEHGRAEASIVILSELSHPNTFRLFPELSLRNHRITLLQSLSKHRQIPPTLSGAGPQLWQDDLCCAATGIARCLSEQSPSTNLQHLPRLCKWSLLIWKTCFFFIFYKHQWED